MPFANTPVRICENFPATTLSEFWNSFRASKRKSQMFACRPFRAENIQPFMAPVPSFRYPSPDAPSPFAQTGIDLFGPFLSSMEKSWKSTTPSSSTAWLLARVILSHVLS